MSSGEETETSSGVEARDHTILVVEDEPKVAEVYESYLIEDYEVRVAHNGAEALVSFDPAVDVVLLDRRMPGMSGDEVLEHLRDWSEDCFIVVVTAVDPEPDVVGMPFDDYLTKPVSRGEVLTSIEQLLMLGRHERLLREYHAVTREIGAWTVGHESDREALEERRRELLAEMRAGVEAFGDASVATAFRELHGLE